MTFSRCQKRKEGYIMSMKLNVAEISKLRRLSEQYQDTESKTKKYDRGPCYAGGCSSSCYGSCKGNCQYGG